MNKIYNGIMGLVVGGCVGRSRGIQRTEFL